MSIFKWSNIHTKETYETEWKKFTRLPALLFRVGKLQASISQAHRSHCKT